MKNQFRLFCILVLMIVLFFSFFNLVDGQEGKKKSMFKERGSKRVERENENVDPGNINLDGIKLAEDGDEADEVTFSSEEDKERKLQNLANLRKQERESVESPLDPKELNTLREDEKVLRKNVLRASLNNGDTSREKAKALHEMGRNVYKQRRYQDIYDISMEILRIHMALDGHESLATAQAMTNVASVSWKVGEHKMAVLLSLRQLKIFLKEYDQGSKEVMICRARIMGYQRRDAETHQGISHKQYMKEREKIDAEKEQEEEEKNSEERSKRNAAGGIEF